MHTVGQKTFIIKCIRHVSEGRFFISYEYKMNKYKFVLIFLCVTYSNL